MSDAELRPGNRVRGFWDLATVLEVLPDGRVIVQFDAVDATGWRVAPYFRQPTIRLAGTLTKVPQDTPPIEECTDSLAGRLGVVDRRNIVE